MKYLIDYNNSNDIKGGGCFDAWCPLCGAPLNGVDYQIEYLEEYMKENVNKDFIKILKSKSKWMNKITILFEGKKAKHGFIETDCNVTFKNKSGETYNYLVEEDKGIPIHTSCWKMVKEKLKINLEYEHFDLKKFKKSNEYYPYTGFNYTPIAKYWEQSFNLKKLQSKKSEWYLLFSPTENTTESKQNIKRILNNVKKLNKKQSKEKKNRPSPSESATQFKEGTKKKGNDGKMYIITVNKNGVKRWQKI